MTVERSARLALIVSLGLAALMLGACSDSGEVRRRDESGNLVPTARELDPAGTLYAETVVKSETGDCSPDTVNVLTCFAYRGQGYEGAQNALGQCLLRSGKTDQGLTWLRRAANAGGADAQKRLAQVYAAGKIVPEDNVEAATWNKLYLRNAFLLSLGVQPDRSVSEQLSGKLSAAENAAADRRVSAWRPSYWQPTEALNATTAATCRVRAHQQRPNIEQYLPRDPNAVDAGGY